MDALIKEQFQLNGYCVLNHLFTQKEVQELKSEINRILIEVQERKSLGANETIGDNDFTKHGVFVGLAANSDMFREAAARPRLVEALRQILGEHIRFLSDKVALKNAEVDFGSPWHQDWPYWKGSHKLSVWIALDSATEENGCLKVIPGSHKQGAIRHTGEANDGKGFSNRMRKEEIDETRAVSLPVEAGGAVIFHDLLLHASHPNTSGKDRWALISTYSDGDADEPEYEWATAAFSVLE